MRCKYRGGKGKNSLTEGDIFGVPPPPLVTHLWSVCAFVKTLFAYLLALLTLRYCDAYNKIHTHTPVRT
jgi:hypothetical protein